MKPVRDFFSLRIAAAARALFSRGGRRGGGSESGMALVTALIIMLFLLPVTVTFLNLAVSHHKATTQDRQIKQARSIANNVLVDLMRQFSQSYYENRYESDYIARGESFYKVGFSSVAMRADSSKHFLYVEAMGKYGKNPSSPLFQKRLRAVIQFISPWTDFGTMINSNFTTSAGNVNYYGKFWINGNYTITGSNVRFYGGPVYVSGNVSGNASVIIDGDLYYGGGSAGAVTVTGTKYNFMPQMTYPAVNTSYYASHYNYKLTSDSTIVFNSNGTFTVVGSTTMAVPSDGLIIYAQNSNLTLRGTVRGRATIVASGTGTKGVITVNDNLVYANGTNSASEDDSLAVVATNKIVFSKTGSDLTVNGVFNVSSSNDMELSGSSGRFFRFYGSRNKGMTISPSTSFSGGRILEYDTNLNRFPPPGLPEKPYLVTWHMR